MLINYWILFFKFDHPHLSLSLSCKYLEWTKVLIKLVPLWDSYSMAHHPYLSWSQGYCERVEREIFLMCLILTLYTTDDMFLQTVLTHWQWALCIDHWHNRACLIRQQWRTEIKQVPVTSHWSQVTDSSKRPFRQTFSLQHNDAALWTGAQFEKRVTCSPNPITSDTLERGLWFLKHYSLAFHWLVMPLLVFFCCCFSSFLGFLRAKNNRWWSQGHDGSLFALFFIYNQLKRKNVDRNSPEISYAVSEVMSYSVMW